MNRVFLFICSCIIFSAGLVMIFSTTSAEILDHDLELNTHQALIKQICFGGIGLLLAFLLWKMGYEKIINYSPYLYLFFTFLLIIVLIPGIGKEVNGSRRWLSLLGISFQPSEFIKYIVPAYFIYEITALQNQGYNFKFFLKIIIKGFIPIFLILLEPNNGTAAVVGLCLIMLCYLAKVPFRYWALPLIVAISIGAIFAYHSPYVSNRLRVYLHPELDLKGKGHQPHQAKIAAGSGKLMGRGPGASLQKWSYLPEAQNDYIAAIYAEEFGFIGILSMIFVYLLISTIGFQIAMQCQDRLGFYFGATITFLFTFQTFMNLGVVSGLLPSTGLNLPLFSQGGTSLMANIAAIGILCDISRKKTTLLKYLND
ncbi:Cell division protein FtsW [Candidatus Rubidus massiliensis]|nr:Cell division protein FtsW [Candidatus Rubidus massiliensis]